MQRIQYTPRLIILALSVAASPIVLAQDDAQNVAPLGGPSIDAQAKAATLVERDYNGKLRPLELRPEVAALDLLGLSDAQLEDARGVVEDRAALTEQLVFQNLLLLTQVGTLLDAAPEGSGLEVLDPELRSRFDSALSPMWTGSPLMQQIVRTLPRQSRGEYRRIVNAWFAAAMTEERERLPNAGVSPFELVVRKIIGQEIDAAFERGQTDRDAAYEAFLDRLDLAPEIEGDVRRVALDAYLEVFNSTGREPNRQEEAQIFQKILEVIPADEHPRVWRAILQVSEPKAD